ncbi:ferredoxin [Candidatus Dependentiae bacterium]
MTKKIEKVSIEPGCISCGTCAAMCPEVFEMDGLSSVKDGANFEKYAEKIVEATEICPVGVIRLNEK